MGVKILPVLLALGTGGHALGDYKLPEGPLQFAKLKPPSAPEVYDAEGHLVGYGPAPRFLLYRPLSQIDPKVVEFTVQAEDAKFWNHGGFDLEEIRNSFEKNLTTGHLKRGGSTISQQLVKNLFLDKKKSWIRKLYEIPWTRQLETDLTKKQIIELYLNVIEWGPGIYGVEAASRHFFDRPAAELEPGQALYLVMIIPNPPRFDLFAHPRAREFLEKKKKDFLNRLVGDKKITHAQRDEYMASDFGLASLDPTVRRFPLYHTGPYAGRRKVVK